MSDFSGTLSQYFIQQPNQKTKLTKSIPTALSLREKLQDPSWKTGAAISPKIQVFEAIFSLLEELHQQGISHRALSPDCVFILEEGGLAFSNLGFAYRVGEERQESLSGPLGVHGYLPPEQAMLPQAVFEPKSDLFSLGAIFYEALCGQKAFPGDSPVEILLATLDKDPTPLRQLIPSIPEALEQLCEKLLQKKVEDRPDSAQDVVEELRKIVPTSETPAPVPFHLGTASTGLLQDAVGTTQAPQHPKEKSKLSTPSGPSGELVGTGPTLSMGEPKSSRQTTALMEVPRGNYLPEGELARGGLGKIIRSRDMRLGREVAVKELLKNQGNARARFLREAMITAQLQHPGIVPIYEAGVWPSGEPFYVMKLIAGNAFDKVIKETPSFAQRLAFLPRVIAASEALAYAHSQKAIHRDLKPHNIIIGDYGETIVIDWGLAKILGSSIEEEDLQRGAFHSEGNDGDLTHTGEIMGTPAYMPIEQAQGKPVDERADVYSLGAILYHLLSGRPPYQGNRSIAVLKNLLAGEPTPLEELAPEIPRDLLAIIKKAMSRNAEERYPNALGFVEDLKKFQTGQLVSVHHYSNIELIKRFISKNKTAFWLTNFLVSVLIIGGFLANQQLRQEKDRANQGWRSATQRGESEKEARFAEELAKNRAIKAESTQLKISQERTFEAIQGALDNDPVRALVLLEELTHYPDFQDPTFSGWGKLRTLAADALSRGVPLTLKGDVKKDTQIKWAEFSPDGLNLVTASSDHLVRLWDTKTWSYRRLEGHTDKVTKVLFSSDGKFVVSLGIDKTVWCWEVTTGKGKLLWSSESPLTDIAMGSDGWVAVVGWDNPVKLWNLNTGESRELGHDTGFSNLVFSLDGRYIVTLYTHELFLWEVATGKGRQLSDLHGCSFQRGLAISPDGSEVASGCYGNPQARKWKTATGKEQILLNSLGTVGSISYSKDGHLLAIASNDKKIRIWKDGDLWKTLEGFEASFDYQALSSDGSLLAAAGFDKSVYLWNLRTGTKSILRGHQNSISSLSFSPDGSKLSSASTDGTVKIWNIPQIMGRTLYAEQAPSTQEQPKWSQLAISSDGKWIATGSLGILLLWDTATGIAQHLGPVDPSEQVTSLAFSPDGNNLATGDTQGTVRLWNLTTNKQTKLFQFHSTANTIAFSKDGRYLAAGSKDHTVWWEDFVTGETRILQGHSSEVYSVAFSPNNQLLLTAGRDKTAKIWDLKTSQNQSFILGFVCSTALFSNDGTTLFLAGLSPLIEVWDVKTGKKERELNKHNWVNSLSLSGDGERLVSTGGTGDQSVRFWDLETGESRAVRNENENERPFRVAFFPDGKSVAVTTKGSLLVEIIPDDLPLDSSTLSSWLSTTLKELEK